MQVKKFEAKTMKEALQLVKQELGPDAIILNAKDNKKSFGLGGSGSIEVTAAISERALKKKQYAESRMPKATKDEFRAKSAKNQKAFIETTVSRYRPTQEPQVASVTRPPTVRRYIDIFDEDAAGKRVNDVLEDFAKGSDRVLEDSALKAKATMAPTVSDEVLSLRREVDILKTLLTQFQQGAVAPARHPLTTHPGADYGLPFELSFSFERLLTAGIDARFVAEILEKADKELSPMEKKKKSLVDAWVAKYILSHTSVVGQWSKVSPFGPQLQLFFGPGGHGKTSALVKVASQLALNERRKVAIFSADVYKVGAAEQLKIFAQILNVPFETVKHTIEFPNLVKKHSKCDVILVDYPGSNFKDIGEIDQFRSLLPSRDIAKTSHLVLSAATNDIDAFEICQRYTAAYFDDVLVTKLDESSVHGFLYNIQRKTEKPLYAFGIGSKIPEDIELATRERVVDLIYKITKKRI